MTELTDQQRTTLRLIKRTTPKDDGWYQCASMIFEQLILPMPDALVEKDSEHLRVRLTEKAVTLLEWL